MSGVLSIPRLYCEFSSAFETQPNSKISRKTSLGNCLVTGLSPYHELLQHLLSLLLTLIPDTFYFMSISACPVLLVSFIYIITVI